MESSEIEQFGRSCLPGRTSRLAATCLQFQLAKLACEINRPS